MRDIVHHLKNLVLIGFIPIAMFWISIGLGFWLYPYDVDAANNLMMIMAGIGCLVAIVLVSLDANRIIKKMFEKDWE